MMTLVEGKIMNEPYDIWEVLKIAPTTNRREIRRAYAEQVKIYHVEEYPEEFARIRQAYYKALTWTGGEKPVVETMVLEDNGASAMDDSILSRLDELHFGHNAAYRNEEVIVRIIEILKNQEESKKPQIWQEFFLSDAFLSVYDREGFIEEMTRAIAQCGGMVVSALEPVFLKELALVYGIVRFEDISDYDRGNKAAVAELLLEQEGADWTVTGEDARLVNRSYSYYYFRRLCRLAEEGGLKDYEQGKWGNLTFYADDNYCPEFLPSDAPQWHNKLEMMLEPHSPTCAAMHGYLVRHYEIPEQVCHAMRDNFEVDGRLGEYPQGSYGQVYEQMCQKYPRMRQSQAAELTNWKIGLLSEPPIFTKRSLGVETMEWLIQVWNIRQCSKELTETVYAAYESEGEAVLPLLEVLIGRMVQLENHSDERPGRSESEKEMAISLHNRYFWRYFFATAYPYSNDGRERKEGDYHSALSMYMSRVYPPSRRFQRMFCRNEITLSHGGKEIKLVFALHHLEYFLEGEPVFYQTLSFEELAVLSESEEEVLKFFLLLPITKITPDAGCREEILRRLKYLPFYRPTWGYLADCLVRNTDWERVPEHPQKILEEVYYSENEQHCFRGSLTGRKFAVDYKTPEGWYGMKLLHGESKGARAIGDKAERLAYMHGIVDGFLPPDPEPVKEISVAGKTALQKSEILFEALIEKRHMHGGARGSWTAPPLLPATQEFLNQWDVRHLGGTNGSVTLWFGKKEEGSLPLLCYMFGEDTWNAKGTLFEIQGEQKKAYLKREERLRCRIGEEADIVGYFRMEHLLPFPIGIGKSEKFYTYFDHRLISAESYPELLTKCIDLDALDRIEIDRGFRTVNKFTRKLESWYSHEYVREINDVKYNYPYELYHELFEEL